MGLRESLRAAEDEVLQAQGHAQILEQQSHTLQQVIESAFTELFQVYDLIAEVRYVLGCRSANVLPFMHSGHSAACTQ